MTRAAKGVLTIANLTMASIIKKVSIARGYDPRDFALFCYGGGGPLHGIELARALKIPRVIVPPEPGNFSAIGMLLADPRLDTAQTFVVRLNPENLAKVDRRSIAELEAQGRRRAAPRVRRRHDHDRARGRDALQGPAAFDQDPIAAGDDAAALRARFDQEYLRRYGHANAAAEVEIVVLHSLATLHMKRPEIARSPGRRAGRTAAGADDPAGLLPGGGSLPADTGLRPLLRSSAGFPRRGPGADRGIRIEHADRAGRQFHHRQARGDRH